MPTHIGRILKSVLQRCFTPKVGKAVGHKIIFLFINNIVFNKGMFQQASSGSNDIIYGIKISMIAQIEFIRIGLYKTIFKKILWMIGEK